MTTRTSGRATGEHVRGPAGPRRRWKGPASQNPAGEAQDSESLARAAAELAHEFKNLFAGILGYIELLLEDLDPADPRRQDVEAIGHSIERAVRLIRSLERFTARGPARSGPPALTTDIS